MASVLAVYNDKVTQLLPETGHLADLLHAIEEKAGVARAYIVYLAVLVASLWLMAGPGAAMLCNLLGFLYPAYCSMQLLEVSSSGREAEYSQWLSYWIIFSFFGLLEFFPILVVDWFPFYWLVKCVLLIWLMSPKTNEAIAAYNQVLLAIFYKIRNKTNTKTRQDEKEK